MNKGNVYPGGLHLDAALSPGAQNIIIAAF